MGPAALKGGQVGSKNSLPPSTSFLWAQRNACPVHRLQWLWSCPKAANRCCTVAAMGVVTSWVVPLLGCVLSIVRHFIATGEVLAVRSGRELGVRLRCVLSIAHL